jgi:hypothetical protein
VIEIAPRVSGPIIALPKRGVVPLAKRGRRDFIMNVFILMLGNDLPVSYIMNAVIARW